MSGCFTFTVRLTDANEWYGIGDADDSRVRTGAGCRPASLPGASINQPYTTTLSAFGGFGPFGWSLAGGALPTGVTLTPAGIADRHADAVGIVQLRRDGDGLRGSGEGRHRRVLVERHRGGERAERERR